jgi:DUF971 family protein
VDLDRRLLQINWAEGGSSTYDFTYLRRACPCAECRPWIHSLFQSGDQDGSREIPDRVKDAIGELASVSDVRPVGSYALSFNWADGHTTGIYDFRYLRSIDPENKDNRP